MPDTDIKYFKGMTMSIFLRLEIYQNMLNPIKKSIHTEMQASVTRREPGQAGQIRTTTNYC